MRYEYKFETVEAILQPKRYRNRIVKRAGEGWRLVQVLVETPADMLNEYVLVLEREVGAGESEEPDDVGGDEWPRPPAGEEDS